MTQLQTACSDRTVHCNVDLVRDTIHNAVHAQSTQLKLAVPDLSAAPHVDLQSAEILGEMANERKVDRPPG